MSQKSKPFFINSGIINNSPFGGFDRNYTIFPINTIFCGLLSMNHLVPQIAWTKCHTLIFFSFQKKKNNIFHIFSTCINSSSTVNYPNILCFFIPYWEWSALQSPSLYGHPPHRYVQIVQQRALLFHMLASEFAMDHKRKNRKCYIWMCKFCYNKRIFANYTQNFYN